MAIKNESKSNAKVFESIRQTEQKHEENGSAKRLMNRRYAGSKEMLGFIIWDAAQSFNINIYSTRFITSIVGIDLGLAGNP